MQTIENKMIIVVISYPVFIPPNTNDVELCLNLCMISWWIFLKWSQHCEQTILQAILFYVMPLYIICLWWFKSILVVCLTTIICLFNVILFCSWLPSFFLFFSTFFHFSFILIKYFCNNSLQHKLLSCPWESKCHRAVITSNHFGCT